MSDPRRFARRGNCIRFKQPPGSLDLDKLANVVGCNLMIARSEKRMAITIHMTRFAYFYILMVQNPDGQTPYLEWPVGALNVRNVSTIIYSLPHLCLIEPAQI